MYVVQNYAPADYNTLTEVSLFLKLHRISGSRLPFYIGRIVIGHVKASGIIFNSIKYHSSRLEFTNISVLGRRSWRRKRFHFLIKPVRIQLAIPSCILYFVDFETTKFKIQTCTAFRIIIFLA